ncbi:Sec-independent protein translocase protein TatB [Hansschlegelia beijingensis]|uniref:Sec-independent protein translocase protein TatB n=1 Tax=Hansschlegelia beijingensis TaxID=1133344 RepID=A0A7W6GGN4_9HYPH|nr:Sec-independent protein translocase protein TatB [Hansschlegelia beijingensis]MBB3974298.1 sec-independent protein translocase protein TatB [Hansschlegelia beijingensis]
MFDIAWSEFLVVAVVALVVIGPRDLPPLLRQLGKTVATLRRMAGDFQSQFNEALREAELDDLQKDLTGLKDTANKMVSAPDPFKMARDEIRSALTAPSKPTPSALAGAAATGAADAPSALAPEPEADATPAPSSAPTADPELPARANGSTHPSGSDPVAASGDPAPGARA